MAIIAGIDPGRVSGVCVFDTKTQKVIDAYIYEWRCDQEMFNIKKYKIERVYIESPIYRTKSGNKVDTIIKLAIFTGRWMGVCDHLNIETVQIPPHQWKGSVPGDIMLERIKKAVPSLSSHLENITRSKQEHVIDACGLVVWGYKRDFQN